MLLEFDCIMSTSYEEILDEPPDRAMEYELSVGDVMTHDYVAVPADVTIDEAIHRFQEHAPANSDQTTVYYIYVVDSSDCLVGVVSLREALSAPRDAQIRSVMNDDLMLFHRDANAKQAALDVADLPFVAVPVVDNMNQLVGIVRSNTLLNVLAEESSEDMLRMQGMDLPDISKADFTDVETQRSTLMLDASLSQILQIRVPWLIVALSGGFLAGGVIGIYEDALETVVILAFFIPVVMDMGGNVGTQSSTIFIRGVVLGHIDRENVIRRIGKETIVGASIGVIVGIAAAMVAYLWLSGLRGDPAALDISLVVLGAMIGTSVVAALVGFLIPWIMYLLGQDPAAASNPIVTTIKDVSGLLIYRESRQRASGSSKTPLVFVITRISDSRTTCPEGECRKLH